MSILEDDGEESEEEEKDSSDSDESEEEDAPKESKADSKKRREKPIPAKNLKRQKVEKKGQTGAILQLHPREVLPNPPLRDVHSEEHQTQNDAHDAAAHHQNDEWRFDEGQI